MKTERITIVATGAVLCLFLMGLASLALGARVVGPEEVYRAVFLGARDNFDTLVVGERIPRTLFALVAGGALGVSGTLMQAVTRNPIADPGILGVNTGASLAVVCGIAFFHIGTKGEYMLYALVGAAITAVFVYTIGSMGRGGTTPIKLALAGAATSAALSSLVSAVILPRVEAMNAFRFWQVGSVGGADWNGIFLMLPFLIAGLLMGLGSATGLNAMALGDELAVGLGARTGIIRLVAAAGGVFLCGAVTALAGPIGFVGLMVPHVVKLMAGPDHRIVIPLSAIGGGILLAGADVIGRLIGSPGELEAGIVTAFVGAPVLIWIAMRSGHKKRGRRQANEATT